jgi:hypothetical protein
MASPRTRRVLQDLKPTDDNSVSRIAFSRAGNKQGVRNLEYLSDNTI